MLAAKVTFDVATVCLIVAVVMFILACPHRVGAPIKGWFLPLGLAFFAFAFLTPRLGWAG